jgi:acetoacetyl-CoA synthetase
VVGQLSRTRDPQKELPSWSSDRVAYSSWNNFLDAGADAPAEIKFNRGPAMRPLWILYSSGTTGKPKAIVHTHGGMLLSAVAAQCLHFDAQPTDTYLQFTTLGWMMWNYQMNHLVLGCALVVFDGSPLQPHGALWEIVERHRVTILNISPRYLQVLLLAGYKPNQQHDVSSIRSIGSAGAPLAPELYDYMFRDVKKGIYM